MSDHSTDGDPGPIIRSDDSQGWVSGPCGPPAETAAEFLARLRAAYPEWTIESGAGGLHVYTAERRTHGGRSLHYLVAHDLAGLAAKLETVEADESGPDNSPGGAQPGGGWISGPCT